MAITQFNRPVAANIMSSPFGAALQQKYRKELQEDQQKHQVDMTKAERAYLEAGQLGEFEGKLASMAHTMGDTDFYNNEVQSVINDAHSKFMAEYKDLEGTDEGNRLLGKYKAELVQHPYIQAVKNHKDYVDQQEKLLNADKTLNPELRDLALNKLRTTSVYNKETGELDRNYYIPSTPKNVDPQDLLLTAAGKLADQYETGSDQQIAMTEIKSTIEAGGNVQEVIRNYVKKGLFKDDVVEKLTNYAMNNQDLARTAEAFDYYDNTGKLKQEYLEGVKKSIQSAANMVSGYTLQNLPGTGSGGSSTIGKIPKGRQLNMMTSFYSGAQALPWGSKEGVDKYRRDLKTQFNASTKTLEGVENSIDPKKTVVDNGKTLYFNKSGLDITNSVELARAANEINKGKLEDFEKRITELRNKHGLQNTGRDTKNSIGIYEAGIKEWDDLIEKNDMQISDLEFEFEEGGNYQLDSESSEKDWEEAFKDFQKEIDDTDDEDEKKALQMSLEKLKIRKLDDQRYKKEKEAATKKRDKFIKRLPDDWEEREEAYEKELEELSKSFDVETTAWRFDEQGKNKEREETIIPRLSQKQGRWTKTNEVFENDSDVEDDEYDALVKAVADGGTITFKGFGLDEELNGAEFYSITDKAGNTRNFEISSDDANMILAENGKINQLKLSMDKGFDKALTSFEKKAKFKLGGYGYEEVNVTVDFSQNLPNGGFIAEWPMKEKPLSRTYYSRDQFILDYHRYIKKRSGKSNSSSSVSQGAGAVSTNSGQIQNMSNPAVVNKNPGNIRDSKGNFKQFATFEEGVKAMENDIQVKIDGKSKHNVKDPITGTDTGKKLSSKSSILDLISVWAPVTDNNSPTEYANFVMKDLGVNADTTIGEIGAEKLAKSMSKFEDPVAHELAYNREETIKKMAAPPASPASFDIPLEDAIGKPEFKFDLPNATPQQMKAADIDSSDIVSAIDTSNIPEPVVKEMEKVKIPDSTKKEVENEPWKVTLLAEDIMSWGSRGAVKYAGMEVPKEDELETVINVKGATTTPDGPQQDLSNYSGLTDIYSNRGGRPQKSYLNAFSDLGYEERVQEKPVKVATASYKNLDPKGKGKFYSYSNEFDGREGFNYVPISNVGNSTYDTTYANVEGIAHFLLDSDASGEKMFTSAGSRAMINNQWSGKSAQNMGSTVKDFYFPVATKNEDGTLNVKYLKKNEINDKSKIMSPLRQYKFSDFDWSGKTSAQGFNSSVASVPTKKAYKGADGNMSNESHFLFPSTDKYNGRKIYGKYGGGSVVFIADTDNGRRVVEVAGTIDTIYKTGLAILETEGIKPEDLIIGYHDVGSFSAKPKAQNGTLSFPQWSGFNNDGVTGGGLAIPKQG